MEISPELDSYIDSLDSAQGSLIAVLHKAQGIYGYLSREVLTHVAERLKLPASKVFGVVTFYSFFNTKPVGKYKVNVCMGTACFVRGAEAVLREFRNRLNVGTGESSEDGLFSLDAIRCVGACGLAPVVSVNGKVYGRVESSQVKEIIEEYRDMEARECQS